MKIHQQSGEINKVLERGTIMRNSHFVQFSTSIWVSSSSRIAKSALKKQLPADFWH